MLPEDVSSKFDGQVESLGLDLFRDLFHFLSHFATAFLISFWHEIESPQTSGFSKYQTRFLHPIPVHGCLPSSVFISGTLLRRNC